MKLSLIIPTYNRAAFLELTLESVLRQTRAPDEVLVIDDGSTDETRGLVESLGAGVRYHYQRNAGLAAARTKGLAISRGELLCFLDSDDLLLPRALEVLEAALLGARDAALAYCRSQTIDAQGKVVEERWDMEDHAGKVWYRLVDGNFIRSSGCALIRRSHLELVEPWDGRLRGNEDWDLWVRLAESAPMVRVDQPLFQYRTHGANMSANVFHMHSNTLLMLRKHLARYRNHPERLRYIRQALTRAHLVVANECFHRAHEARLAGDGRLALLQLSRAVRLRPHYLRDRKFVSEVLNALRTVWAAQSTAVGGRAF